MAEMKDLLKLKTFFSAERQAWAAIQAPEDFQARVEKLTADYSLREQALLTLQTPPAVAETSVAEAVAPMALRLPRRRYLGGTTFAALAAAAVIFLAIGLSLPEGDNLARRFSGLVEIKAAYAASGGVDTREGFIISASQPLPSELVQQSLHVSPYFEYQLLAENDSTYRVLPTEPLDENTVYNLSFDPERTQENKPVRAEYSWSFQTEAAFVLLDISPTDTAEAVPAEALLCLTFDREVELAAAEYIEIEPPTAGEWRAENAVLSFTPQNGWLPGRVYTVRVSAETPAADGSLLAKSERSRFITAEPPPQNISFSLSGAENSLFTPEEIPSWPLLTQQEGDDVYIIELFELPGMEAYAAALTQGLELPATPLVTHELIAVADEEGLLTLSLPASLPLGFYAARLSEQGQSLEFIFQVSDIRAYMSLVGAQRLFWLHDGLGQPLAGAHVWRWPDSAEQVQTDADGLLLLSAGRPDEQAVYCVAAEGQNLLLALPQQPLPAPSAPGRFFLHTEQSFYAPGQTVNFFGFLPSGPQGEAEQISLRLKGAGTEGYDTLPYQTKLESGIISGSLSLPGLEDGWYELALYAGKCYVGGCYIEVGQSAPYQLSITPAQPWALAGEEAEWLVEARYTADNAPIPGVSLLVEDDNGLALWLETDKAGRASLLAVTPSDGGGLLFSHSLRVTANLPGEAGLVAEASLAVLAYDVFVEATVEPIDPDSWHLQLEPYSLLLAQDSAAPPRAPFSGQLSLDATLMLYDGEALPVVEREFVIELAEGQIYSQQLNLPQPGNYMLLLAGRDSGGRPFKLELPLSEAEEANQSLRLVDSYGEQGDGEHSYAPEEPLNLRLYRGNKPVDFSAGSRGLFLLEGEGLLDFTAAASGQAGLNLADADENVRARAVYFEQGQYYESEQLTLVVTLPAAAQLSAALEPQGGEEGTALLTLTLRDTEGRPLSATLSLRCAGRFVTLNTDAQGRAELELPLPQDPFQPQTLHWQAYAAARELFAAGSLELDFRPPFALTASFAGPFLAGDAPQISFLAQGTALAEDDDIVYEISLPGLEFRQKVSGAAEKWQECALPALPAGDYELLLSAQSGRWRDTLALPFTVEHSLRGQIKLQQQQLKNAALPTLSAGESATLIFSDSAGAETINGLFTLLRQDASRLDYKLAAHAAYARLTKQFAWAGEAPCGGIELYQRGDGGLAPLPRAASSRELSALAAPLAAEVVNREALAAYLLNCYESSEQDEARALALYGLAALGQPVLLDIEHLNQQENSQLTKLYLALAYYACGNGAAAKALTVELLAIPDWQEEERETATALLALLADIFELAPARDLYAALIGWENPSYAAILARAQILAARSNQPQPRSYFSYKLGEETQSIRLHELESFTLKLSAGELAQISFSEITGDVVVSVFTSHNGAPEAEQEYPLTLVRYGQNQSARLVLQRDSLLEIRLDFSLPEEAPPGYYRITETLPAGLSFIALDTSASARRLWLFKAQGQSLSFDIYKGEGAYHGSVIYAARASYPGRYYGAAPLIQAVSRPDIAAEGQAWQIEIK